MPVFPRGLERIPSSTGGKLGLKQGGTGWNRVEGEGRWGGFPPSASCKLNLHSNLSPDHTLFPIPTLLLSPLFLSA